jgi:hypothetical protein
MTKAFLFLSKRKSESTLDEGAGPSSTGIRAGKASIILLLLGYLISLGFIPVANQFSFWSGGFLVEAFTNALLGCFCAISLVCGLVALSKSSLGHDGLSKDRWSLFASLMSAITLFFVLKFWLASQPGPILTIVHEGSTQASALPPAVLLPIPDRPEDSMAPAEGWCGETCIQMALGSYGKEVPQSVIHAAGHPGHPDLYYFDIDRALDTLGARYTVWNTYDKDMTQFITWIQSNLAQGHPVLCGLKHHPTRHPWWPIDHFVLVVGYNQDGLVLNTNNSGDGQLLVSYSKLTSNPSKYSFVNPYHCYFGRAITGIR